MKLKQIKLKEMILTEKGTDYFKQAVKILVDAGLFDEQKATEILTILFRGLQGEHPGIGAFNHAPNWASKYLKGIARMMVEETHGNAANVSQFISNTSDIFSTYIDWVINHRNEIGTTDKERTDFDNKFIQQMHFKDVKDFVDEIEAKLNAESDKALENGEFSGGGYKLQPIDSYQQMHQLYGGHWTGDGTDREGQYAGGGGSSWCHTNNKGTYDYYINKEGGGNKFFVLEKDGWKDIKFDSQSNRETRGLDDYGMSLIAILVSPSGKLINTTLRCNHKGDPVGAGDDKVFKTYGDLATATQFNVRDEIRKYLGLEELGKFDANKAFIVKDGIFMRNRSVWNEFSDEIEEVIMETRQFVVPNGVEVIADETFSNFKSLQKVTLPEGLQVIGDGAFYYCQELVEINLPNSLVKIGIRAFYQNENLRDVVLPPNIKQIGTSAFAFCHSISGTLVIPKSVQYCKEAFYGCENIESVEFEANEIQLFDDGTSMSGVFADCLSLKNIKLPVFKSGDGSMIIPGSIIENTRVSSIEIPEGVVTIQCSTFADTSLKTIKLPSTLKNIGSSAFCNNSALTSVELPSGLTTIERNAFYNCTALTGIKLPESVTYIGSGAFEDCKNLNTVIIGNGVDYIGDKAFAYDHGIKSITIPGSVDGIDSYAFYECVNLTNVVIEEGVKAIGRGAFAECGLTSIKLPDSVVELDVDAFDSSVTIITENEKLAKYCVQNGLSVQSSKVKVGRPYLIYTREDYNDRYGDIGEFEGYMDLLGTIYHKHKINVEKINDDKYRLCVPNFSHEDFLEVLANKLNIKDKKIRYLKPDGSSSGDESNESLRKGKNYVNRKNSQKRK